MGVGLWGLFTESDELKPVKVGRPHRGKRRAVKAARKAARR